MATAIDFSQEASDRLSDHPNLANVFDLAIGNPKTQTPQLFSTRGQQDLEFARVLVGNF